MVVAISCFSMLVQFFNYFLFSSTIYIDLLEDQYTLQHLSFNPSSATRGRRGREAQQWRRVARMARQGGGDAAGSQQSGDNGEPDFGRRARRHRISVEVGVGGGSKMATPPGWLLEGGTEAIRLI
jgi:hypothetical protein